MNTTYSLKMTDYLIIFIILLCICWIKVNGVPYMSRDYDFDLYLTLVFKFLIFRF